MSASSSTQPGVSQQPADRPVFAHDRHAAKEEVTDEEKFEDILFYMKQLSKLIWPVVSCMLLTILWVKITQSSSVSIYQPRPYLYASAPTGAAASSSSATSLASAEDALIFLGVIIVMTVGLVILIWKQWFNVLKGFVGFSVTMCLGLIGGLLFGNVLQVFNVPMDWITIVVFAFNYSVLGIVSVFWKGPLKLQQFYLTFFSSIAAYSFTGISEVTTWILLSLLVCWDLFAVLAPCGPLKKMIELSKENQGKVPDGLLFTVGAVYTIDGEEEEKNSGIPPVDSALPEMPSLVFTPSESNTTLIPTSKAPEPNGPITIADHHQPIEDAEEDDDQAGLKLGLGDFVFYSILVSLAAKQDWITTVTCLITVLTGLTMTIFLLPLMKRALPALPISLAFGLLFYFASSLALVPYIDFLGTNVVFF